MTERVEFGSGNKSIADTYRDEYDERTETGTDSETEQQIPDAFNVAEGGQRTF